MQGTGLNGPGSPFLSYIPMFTPGELCFQLHRLPLPGFSSALKGEFNSKTTKEPIFGRQSRASGIAVLALPLQGTLSRTKTKASVQRKMGIA